MSGMGQARHDGRRDVPSDPEDTSTRRWWVVGGVVGLALVALGVVSLSGNPNVRTQPSTAVSTEQGAAVSSDSDVSIEPNAATDVAMLDFDGNTVTISDLGGWPVVINFWSTWCPACFAEMPAFEKVYQANRESVQFLGINLSEDIEGSLNVVEETGVTYPLARDPRGEVFTAFGGYGMPTTVFLDENGGVVEMYTGELTAGELEARIVEYFEN